MNGHLIAIVSDGTDRADTINRSVLEARRSDIHRIEQPDFPDIRKVSRISYTCCSKALRTRHVARAMAAGASFSDQIAWPNWSNWLGIVGTSSAISSIVVLAIQGMRDRVVRRRERRDAALDVALSLETYARVCRAMMHRADWAREEVTRSGSREAAQSAMLPVFAYPEKIQWRRLSHRVASDLRDFPARIHAGREDLNAFSEFGEPVPFCDEIRLESAKAARDALTLARETRKKHGCVPWRPGAKDADLNRELLAFIAHAEEAREAQRTRSGGSLATPSAKSFGSAAADARIA